MKSEGNRRKRRRKRGGGQRWRRGWVERERGKKGRWWGWQGRGKSWFPAWNLKLIGKIHHWAQTRLLMLHVVDLNLPNNNVVYFTILFRTVSKLKFWLCIAEIHKSKKIRDNQPNRTWPTFHYSTCMQQLLPKAGVKSEMPWWLYKLKIYKCVTNTWLFECKSNVQSFGFLAELFRGMLFKWKGANSKSHQKWDFIVNLGLWLVK